MDGAANFTLTPCGVCHQTSVVAEGMICCDSCDVWFHGRCVGLESVDKYAKKNWYCQADACQLQADDYRKKREAESAKKRSKKTLATDDGSDRSSVKSDRQTSSVLERKLKALAQEQKAKEAEMEIERILAEKRMEMDRTLKEKRSKMEEVLREKQAKQEEEMYEEDLKKKMAHVDRIQQIRDSYEARMGHIQQRLDGLIFSDPAKNEAQHINELVMKDPEEGFSGELVQSAPVVHTPLPNPNVGAKGACEKQDEHHLKKGEKRHEQETDRSCDESEIEEEYSDEEGSSDWDSDCDSEAPEILSQSVAQKAVIPGDRKQRRKVESKTSVHGLGQRKAGPTRMQMAARQGITKKLPIFSGRPEEWPLFIGTYQASNQACGFTDIENLVRLQESVKGPALDSVRGQLLLPRSVPKAIEKLRQLYGRPEQLLQCYLEKVRGLESPKADKLASFIPFGNAVEQLCDHLEAAELDQHLMNPLLIQELVDKLPARDKREWVRYKKRKSVVTLRTFTDFVSMIVSEACEANAGVGSAVYKPLSNEASSRNRAREKGTLNHHGGQEEQTKAIQITEQKRKQCKVCHRTDHRLRFCQDFEKMRLADRIKIVERYKLCKVCLNDHGTAQCKFNLRCRVGNCRERHHYLLHNGVESVAINAHIRTNERIMFRMLPVTLYNGNKAVNTIAFLDEGASVTLLEKSLADRLDVAGVHEPLTIKWTADVTRVESNSMRMNLWISARGSGNKIKLQMVRTVDELTLPHQELKAAELSAQYKFLKKLPIYSYEMQRPGILIGLNNIDTFAPIESRMGRPGEPIAVRSKLGWTVYGPKVDTLPVEPLVGFHERVTNEDLHSLLKTYYAVEESNVTVLQESKEDRRARDILERTTKRVGEHFETGLLWKCDDPQFPDSYPMAMRRLKHLEQKLAKSPKLYENVCKQVQEYQIKGYAHLASEDELSGTDNPKVWYLPLNVVLHPRKPEKVRLVWDAAATVKGVSLNSQLLTGPDMLVPLTTVINRFRERRIAFGADIREMYHQIRIRDEDKQAQRFLFRTNPLNPPDIYVMDVATFGSTSSPCSAQYVKNLNASEYADKFPEAAAAIVENHYVDDYFDSADSVQEAIRRASEVREIHSRAGFEIRNWVSNSNEVLEGLGKSATKRTVHFHRDKTNETERVLGIIWDPVSDVFSFSTEHRENLRPYLQGATRPTKRLVLSCVMGFFDPQGLLAPFTIHGRMLVQDLWRTGCQWDDEIDDSSFAKWKRWTSLLPEVNAIRIPRCYFNCVSADGQIELHIFTDASEFAYGCVAYFRTIKNGKVQCSLVMSRSKVAPLKRQSIPRLELMAAVLGARAMHSIQSSHSFPIQRRFLWTDSSTVLSWIRSEQNNYKQFTAFRIGEIVELTSVSDWRWVKTKFNIADVLTKWGKGPPLQSEGPWFQGSELMYQLEQDWPRQVLPAPGTKEEMRAFSLFHDVNVPERLMNVQNVSRWLKLLRTTATVGRFIENCRRKRVGLPIYTLVATIGQLKLLKGGYKSIPMPLTQEELQKAETVLWRQVQAEAFPDEVKILLKNRNCKLGQSSIELEKSSEIFKLSPVLDTDGVIRMNGRLKKSEFASFDMKFPIILPKTHEITKKLIHHFHEKFGHANRETVFNELRQRFYIPKLRITIKQVMKECMWCRVNRCHPAIPQMASLPVQRVTPNLRPFSSVGVDYLGPIGVTVGRRKEKRWIALFTCLAIRAVHLEVVHGLSTQACLMAIRRFICQRGAPEEFFSDNGTNFKGACNEMMKAKKEIDLACAQQVTSPTIRWHFNPPGTPHMGGIWERMVRSVKAAMMVLDDGRKLTDEILLTTLAEAEDMINSRPLTYIPQESADTEALTPNHFLRGTVKSSDMPVSGPTNMAEALRDMYARSQYLADKMWERWQKEYLPSINQRTKWHRNCRPLNKGDLVFIVDGKNRKNWTRGIVEEPITGSDGVIRQAMVRTGNGVFRRGVANLAVMEVSDGKFAPVQDPVTKLRAGDLFPTKADAGVLSV
ncbi:uncharacterized protein LOC131680761 [Topomyia yanbarensis]|uniref:uncharacterized protein LOC131680761 n=1 Tax=Topomyia yanbarensis TaxID=2498891 RepID=UPI00273C9C08|nr:uncharacterized protein LOC131680761 [Topomyia yanbarensis]